MRAFRAPDMTSLHAGLCETLVTSPAKELDMVTSVDVQIHNVIAEAATMHWDFDLKDMWLTPGRWSMMVRQYLDPVQLVEWINKSAQLINWGGRGISMMRTKVVLPRGGAKDGNKETRRWGSCMLAISYKAMPAPQITLYSRTSYLGYLGALDMTVAWMCGRYLAEVMNGAVEGMKFVWINEAMQYHHFKSLAYLLNHQDEQKREYFRHIILSPEDELSDDEVIKLSDAPALMYSRRWMQKVLEEDARGETYGDMSYNTYRRIKRRFHTEVLGYDYALQFEGWQYWKKGPNMGEQRAFHHAYKPLPHTPAEHLDFRPLGLPGIDNLTGVDYDSKAAEKAMKEADEDD